MPVIHDKYIFSQRVKKSLDICVKLPPFSALKNLRQHCLLASVSLFPQCAFILFCEGGPKQKEDMQNKALPPSFALFPWPNTTKLNVSYHKNPSKN